MGLHHLALAWLFAALQATASTTFGSDGDLTQHLVNMHSRSTVLDTDLLQDSTFVDSTRQLLQSNIKDWDKYKQEGRYVVIENPMMPGELGFKSQTCVSKR
jgi:hypothetical protein